VFSSRAQWLHTACGSILLAARCRKNIGNTIELDVLGGIFQSTPFVTFVFGKWFLARTGGSAMKD